MSTDHHRWIFPFTFNACVNISDIIHEGFCNTHLDKLLQDETSTLSLFKCRSGNLLDLYSQVYGALNNPGVYDQSTPSSLHL
jgi:hypothetical protein